MQIAKSENDREDDRERECVRRCSTIVSDDSEAQRRARERERERECVCVCVNTIKRVRASEGSLDHD